MKSSRTVALADLEAEITTVRWGQAEDAPRATCLRFTCPLCGAHQHLVPYEPGVRAHGKRPVIGNVWGHQSGSAIADLTLSPSYLAISTCRLHAFIRNGQVQILGDSRAG